MKEKKLFVIFTMIIVMMGVLFLSIAMINSQQILQ